MINRIGGRDRRRPPEDSILDSLDRGNHQANNSLNVRNTLPAIKRLQGDPKIAAEYLPIAQTILGDVINRTELGRIAQGAKHVRLSDGTEIRVIRNGDIRIIEVDVRKKKDVDGRSIYVFLETGLVNLGNISSGALPTTNLLYYGGEQYEALNTSLRPRWLDEIALILNQNDVLLSVTDGEVRAPHAVEDGSGYPPADHLHSIALQTFEYFAGGIKTFEYTRTQACTPNPGYATGRLKLYLQAILGGVINNSFVLDEQGKTDPFSEEVSAIVSGIMGDYWQSVGNPNIAFNWDYSRGMYVSDDYEYWLLKIDGISLSAQKLYFPFESAILRRTLLQNQSLTFIERTKIESYFLSRCVKFGPAIPINDGLLAGMAGSPLHEGWKFNYKGDEAQIVTMETISASGVISHHIFRRYKITLSFLGAKEDVPFSAALSTVEEVSATPFNKCLRPWRKPASFGHILEWEDWHEWRLGPTRGYPASMDFDAPMYCWYSITEDGESRLVVVRDKYSSPSTAYTNAQVDTQFNNYAGGMTTGSFYACGPSASRRDQDVFFTNYIDSRNGYYLATDADPGEISIHEDLLESPEYYTYYHQAIDMRVDFGPTTTRYRTAMANFGGYNDLDYWPLSAKTCSGSDPQEIPDRMYGGIRVDIVEPSGAWESFMDHRRAVISFRHTLVFPYNSGDSVYIQRDEISNEGHRNVEYSYTRRPTHWSGTAVFEDAHTEFYENEPLRWWMRGAGIGPYEGDGWVLSHVADSPTYNDVRFQQDAGGGQIYRAYEGNWDEEFDTKKLYYASAGNSELTFNETAIHTGAKRYAVTAFAPPYVDYPAEGITPSDCFGEHKWEVEISPVEFYPWFDAMVALNESYRCIALTLKQWGLFENGVLMTYRPMYNVTDDTLPLIDWDTWQEQMFASVFVGWA